MLNKRGMDLSINTIILLILGLIVLVVMIIIFSGPSGDFFGFVKEQLGIGGRLVNETNPLK